MPSPLLRDVPFTLEGNLEEKLDVTQGSRARCYLRRLSSFNLENLGVAFMSLDLDGSLELENSGLTSHKVHAQEAIYLDYLAIVLKILIGVASMSLDLDGSLELEEKFEWMGHGLGSTSIWTVG